MAARSLLFVGIKLVFFFLWFDISGRKEGIVCNGSAAASSLSRASF
jgi:hypothetical protein